MYVLFCYSHSLYTVTAVVLPECPVCSLLFPLVVYHDKYSTPHMPCMLTVHVSHSLHTVTDIVLPEYPVCSLHTMTALVFPEMALYVLFCYSHSLHTTTDIVLSECLVSYIFYSHSLHTVKDSVLPNTLYVLCIQ